MANVVSQNNAVFEVLLKTLKEEFLLMRKENKTEHVRIYDKIDSMRESLALLRVRVATIGAIFGMLAAVSSMIVKHLLGV